ncbi:MAG: hypothetical protein M3179_02955 [Actinomycetota bacterium]|nr:hypothetical protein [Actinomycetota bacterium]
MWHREGAEFDTVTAWSAAMSWMVAPGRSCPLPRRLRHVGRWLRHLVKGRTRRQNNDGDAALGRRDGARPAARRTAPLPAITTEGASAAEVARPATREAESRRGAGTPAT